jgi:hypothetical protein
MNFKDKILKICKTKAIFFLIEENGRQVHSNVELQWEKAKKEILDAIHNQRYDYFLRSVERFKSLKHSTAERSWYVENIYMKMAPDFLAHHPDIVDLLRNDSQFFNERPPVAQHCFEQYAVRSVEIIPPLISSYSNSRR